MNKEIGMILPNKRVNTSGVGESNNYYEDIYNIYTVEPPIADPPKSGQPPDSGQPRCPRMTSIHC